MVIKSRNMRWAAIFLWSGEIRKAYGNGVRKISTEYSLFGKLVVGERIMLKYILEN
jgi:hypothetical protein